MADIISTIGATGDYATLAAWNSALGGAAGGVGDTAIAELIDPVSTITGNLIISNTDPDALIIRPAAGNEHDGLQNGAGATVEQPTTFSSWQSTSLGFTRSPTAT